MQELEVLKKQNITLNDISSNKFRKALADAIKQVEIEKEMVKQHEKIIDEVKKRVLELFESNLVPYGINKLDQEFVCYTYVAQQDDKIVIDLDQFKECCPEEYKAIEQNFNKIKKGAKSYIKVKIKEEV